MAMPPRPLGTLVDAAMQAGGDIPPELQGLDIPVVEPETFEGGAEVIPQDDGSAVVQALAAQMEQSIPMDQLIPHDANLAEFLDDGILAELSSDLLQSFQDDLSSRDEWEETYKKGLDLLGIKVEERSNPFEGASAVTHPLISESVTQFQAQAYKELLPAGGPVKTRIVGASTREAEDQAARVKEYMNYLITEKMDEYDPDMDQMLFYLPLSGSTFKKVYFDPTKGRPVSKFVPAQDIVVPYSATDLFTAPRITHVLSMSDNEVRKLQVSGFYRDIDLPSPGSSGNEDPVDEEVDNIQGTSRSMLDDTRELLEVHSELDIEGFEDTGPDGAPTGIKLPYIVTIDKDSGEVLSIRRNYEEQDPLRQAIPYFVHYKFLPGLGFYGFGLTHMIGGLGRAATSILRQLIDAGTLANLPAGFKARGVRVRDSDSPLQPGEWRDMDAPGGNIRDSLIPLPYKEPSGTLAQLLGALVESGRRFVSIADQQISSMSQEMPVGTTVAMLERGMKVMSAIHKRLHYAQKNEFRILARVIADNAPMTYPYAVQSGMPQVIQSDFDDRVDILPVSDPNIFSMAQRVTLAQTQLQLAQSNPQMHNLHAAYRRMYQALEVQNIDEILPPQPQPQPTPASMENSSLLLGMPAQAFEQQSHEAHVKAHIALLQTPPVQLNPQVMSLVYSHIMQHIRFLAQQQVVQGAQDAIAQVQLGVQAGAIDPIQAQQQIAMAQQGLNDPNMVEEYVSQLESQILEQMLPQLVPPPPDPEADPLVQIRNQELMLKAQKQATDAQMDAAQLQLDAQKLQQKAAGESARLELQEEIADDRNAVNRERIDMQRQNMLLNARNNG
jgi:hypothetical protein